MPKHKHESPTYALSVFREYIISHRTIAVGGYNFRDIKQHGNSLDFKLGEVTGKITLNNSIGEGLYPSKLEVQTANSAPDSRIFVLGVKKTKNKRISPKSYSLFEDYLRAVAEFSSEYSERARPLRDSKVSNQ